MRKLLVVFSLCGILLFTGIALGRIGGGDIKYEVKRVGEKWFSVMTPMLNSWGSTVPNATRLLF